MKWGGVLLLLAAPAVLAEECQEFYQLVQQWGPTYCSHSHCQRTPQGDKFTLHGLWPSYYSKCRGRPYPEGPSCAPQCDCPFDVSTLEDLKPHLGEEWPSYMGPDEGFWKHEWDKHGSCLITYEAANDGTVTDEHAYFQTALNLKSQCDLMEVLSQAGISPGNSASAETISRAIQKGCGGAKPELECCQHCQGNYLESVYTCFNKDFAAVDCKAVTSWGICTGDVTIPMPDTVLSLGNGNLTRTQ